MLKLKRVYICDNCGAIALPDYICAGLGDCVKVKPMGWGKFGGMDLCPECHRAIQRVFEDGKVTVTVGNPLFSKEGAEDA